MLFQRHVVGPELAPPDRVRGNVAHRLDRIGQRLDPAIERVGPAACEGLDVALPGDMHDGVRHLEIAVVEALRNFEAD